MNEKNTIPTDLDAALEKMRQEFALRADRAGTVGDLAGGPVDRDHPQDFWSFTDEELENELWGRIAELDGLTRDPGALAEPPTGSAAGRSGPWGKIKGAVKKAILRMTRPLARARFARQARLNRRFEHAQFVQFLAAKKMRLRLEDLERANRELELRLAAIEMEKASGGGTSGHE
jgi:hypothetical protein